MKIVDIMLFKKPSAPSALQLAVAELEETQRDRLKASSNREYYVAVELMYAGRIERLRQSIKELSNEPKPENGREQEDRLPQR